MKKKGPARTEDRKTGKQEEATPRVNGTNGVNGANGTPGKRRSYRRTTPVGRIKNHLAKALKIASFVVSRIERWKNDNDEVADMFEETASAQRSLSTALSLSDYLFREDWTPPKRSGSMTFKEGDEVAVVAKYRTKYLEIYTPQIVDNLVVARVLATGELAVKDGNGGSPFLVPKSHLQTRSRGTKLLAVNDTRETT